MDQTVISTPPKAGYKADILNGIVIPESDSCYVTTPQADTEVYTFKNDGATVATITVTYTDANKDTLLSVVKS